MHLDMRGESQADAVARLVPLGATVHGQHAVPGLEWTVFTDPEGNEFCVGDDTGQ